MRELPLPRLPGHLAQIDILKGLAIVAVLFLHSLSVRWLNDGVTVLYIGQAVPVFVVLMGLNAAGSQWRRRDSSLRALYTRRYLLDRLDRLYRPFLVVLIVDAALAAARGSLTLGGLAGGIGLGIMPYGGPGNYFITFAFEFAVVFPAYCWAYFRAPRRTTAAAFFLAAAFQALAPHIHQFDTAPYVYSAALPRLMPFFALGAVLAERMLRGRGLPAWWAAAAGVSVAYLLIVHFDVNAFALDDADWRHWGETFASAFYPALLVAAGLRWLPGASRAWVPRALAALGRASYEIFLLQIVFFGVTGPVPRGLVVPCVIACCLLGLVLHRAMNHVPRLTVRDRDGAPPAGSSADSTIRLRP